MADDVAVTDTTDVTDSSNGSGNSTWKTALDDLFTSQEEYLALIAQQKEGQAFGYPGAPGSVTGPYPNGYFVAGGATSPGALSSTASSSSGSSGLVGVLAIGFLIYKLVL